jgi:hypothetical protein
LPIANCRLPILLSAGNCINNWQSAIGNWKY